MKYFNVPLDNPPIGQSTILQELLNTIYSKYLSEFKLQHLYMYVYLCV